MKKQSKIEKKNEFRCMCCNKLKLRGVMVTVKKGEYSKLGYVVKTCQSAKCIENASNGKFGA